MKSISNDKKKANFSFEQIKINLFYKFALVGSFIFFIDYLLFQISILFFNSLISRTFSYSVSTYLAWLINCKFTFTKRIGSLKSYFFGALFSGTQNVLLSIYLIKTFSDKGYMQNFICIGAGCVYGLFINFIFQAMITFRKNKNNNDL